MTYLEFDFKIEPPQPGCDIVLAELAAMGFESFVERADGLLAYIPIEDFNQVEFDRLYILNNPEFEIFWSKREIAQKNWNAEWERNFNPIRIADRLAVRAPFHSKENVDYDIVIEPKMSFGTGHHETTHMMLQQILEHDFSSKTVLDMGCGTGVLAILAEMRGASQVDAIDVDPWCVENSLENVERNNCKNINVLHGDSAILTGKNYDVIFANINRNILLNYLPSYTESLKNNGWLFLSGFYEADLKKITAKCESLGLSLEKKRQKGEWVSAKYVF